MSYCTVLYCIVLYCIVHVTHHIEFESLEQGIKMKSHMVLCSIVLYCIISFNLSESVGQPDIQPKAPVSHDVQASVIGVTKGG